MLSYYYFDRIRARVYNSGTGDWDKWGTTDAIPNTDVYTQNFSAIASDVYGYTSFNITYADELSDDIYYNQFNYITQWNKFKNLSSIVPGSATHHSPSISNGPTYTNGSSPAVHVAWVRTTGSGSGAYDNKIIHRWTSSAHSWPSVYYTTYYQLQINPTISGVGSTGNYTAYLVWEIQGNAGIARQYFNGSSWSYPTTINYDGKYPSLSTGGSEAKYFYTDETGPIFDVTLSSQSLSKSSTLDTNFKIDELVYKRSISFMDTTGAFLDFIVHDVEQVDEFGFKNSKEMKAINQDEVDLSIQNALKTLNLIPNEIDKNSDLNFKLEIRGNRVSELFEDGVMPEITVGNQKLKHNDQLTAEYISSLTETDQTLKREVSISSSVLEQESVFNLLDLESYLNFKEGVFASLGHIIDRKDESVVVEKQMVNIESEIESELSTSAHPNPFNPSTTINFTLPNESNVVLRVFDVLGREVAELLNEVKSEGSHSVYFDASSLSSGVYFYTIEAGDKIITNRITLMK